jgi:glycine cleavage system T protein
VTVTIEEIPLPFFNVWYYPSSMNRTILYERHLEAGAKMAPFAGWEMPIQYTRGPIEEHLLVRRSAGVFDTCHMGRINVSGPGSLPYLEHLLTVRIGDLSPGFSCYSLLLREDGGILDDLFVYRLSEEEWFLVVNAANTQKDLAWLNRWAEKNPSVQIEDFTSRLGMLAFQGPKALEVLLKVVECPSVPFPPPRFGWVWADIQIHASAQLHTSSKVRDTVTAGGSKGQELEPVGCLIGRTGYTGEDGVEIFCALEEIPLVWDTLLETAGEMGIEASPIGLAARDSLRFEPGFSLYGHELSETVTPVEAGLLWTCNLEKPFIGRDAVVRRKEEGPREKLATFVMEDPAVPRAGYEIRDEEGHSVGRVVTGLYAPTVHAFAGNAYVRPDLAGSGKTFYIVIRGALKKARTVKRPLYKPAYRTE